MKSYFNTIRLSVRHFGSIASIAVCGMLLALVVILSFFTVNVSPLLKIGFSFLPVAASGMLFGPVAGGVVGALGDVITFMLHPTGPYFPGFTLDGFLSGFVYGLIIYGRPVTLRRSLVAKAAVTVLVSLLLNPLWLSVLYGKAFFAVVSARVAANLVQLPVNVALLFAMLKVMEKSHISQLRMKQ